MNTQSLLRWEKSRTNPSVVRMMLGSYGGGFKTLTSPSLQLLWIELSGTMMNSFGICCSLHSVWTISSCLEETGIPISKSVAWANDQNTSD